MSQPESTERCPRCAEAEALKRISDSQAHEAWIERDGALARLAEAEKERDEALKLVAGAEAAYAGSDICGIVISFMEAAGCGRPGTPNTIWAMTKELIAKTGAAEERAAQAERERNEHVAEINRRLKERGFAPGELQAALRGLGGDHLAPFTTQEIELGLLDAFSNMGGATVWCGDGSSCAAQIVEHQLALQEASKARAPEAPVECMPPYAPHAMVGEDCCLAFSDHMKDPPTDGECCKHHTLAGAQGEEK